MVDPRWTGVLTMPEKREGCRPLWINKVRGSADADVMSEVGVEVFIGSQ